MTSSPVLSSAICSPLVLLHGAWHDSRCWETVAELLRNAGLEVYTPDLPGHGQDTTPLNRISLRGYVKAVLQLLEEIGKPVILVGHSMAGMILAQCCNDRPELIRNAVYLCAYLPRNDESLFDLISINRSHEPFIAIEMALQMSADKRSCTINSAEVVSLFYSQADRETAELAQARLCVQATLPLAGKVTLTEEQMNKTPRTYICCTKDKVIPLHHQRRMITRQPCQSLLQIEADHSPFYSDPVELAELLVAIAGPN